ARGARPPPAPHPAHPAALRQDPPARLSPEASVAAGGADGRGLPLTVAVPAEPPGAVLAHGLDQRQQVLALAGEAVVDPGRHLAVDAPVEDPLLLQRAQAQGERPG